MLKLSELRIGNLVFDEDHTEQFVRWVTPAAVLHDSGMLSDPRFIYPIPVREEWLLKFGFHRRIVCQVCGGVEGRKECGNNEIYTEIDTEGHRGFNRIGNKTFTECNEIKKETDYFRFNRFEMFYGKSGMSGAPFFINEPSDEWSFSDGNMRPVRIKYVHQLQNLYFALTNEELKITL